MINVDFVNIDNAKLVGRLLPYWARGKNTSLFLQAILNPIISVHNNFKLWALERYIYAHITSQAMSIEWYLTYRFKSHFANKDHSFVVSDHLVNIYTCFGGEVWINESLWENDVLWPSQQIDAASTYSDEEDDSYIYIYAPEIVSTINYNQDDYMRDINYIVSQFITNFKPIKIIIINKQQ